MTLATSTVISGCGLAALRASLPLCPRVAHHRPMSCSDTEGHETLWSWGTAVVTASRKPSRRKGDLPLRRLRVAHR